MGDGVNRQVVVAELPHGRLEERHFTLREGPVPEPGPGEVRCRTLLLSIDAANRAWMQGATYTAPVLQGDVMHGFGLARVEASRADGRSEGDVVECQTGWQDLSVHRAEAVTPISPRGPLSHHLSVYGITGLTAYFGLLEVGRPQPGETVVVSAAAGAVGNVAAQLARRHGCRVVGIAGSPEKCAWLRDELGLDGVVDYRAEGLRDGLERTCPDGIDVYFDNVGGDVLGACLWRMNLYGRIVCCGVVSQYDTDAPAPGPRGVPGLIVTKRLRMEGFIVMDFFDRRRQAEERLAGWVADGRLAVHEDVVEGLEGAPAALVGLLHGDNVGKRMVRVAPEDMVRVAPV